MVGLGRRVFSGFGTLLALSACGSDKPEPPPPSECASLDYAKYASEPAVSFKDDVMPIFGASCTQSLCHNQKDHEAGLDLGVRCATDPKTKICAFPATADPNSTQSNPPQPLTQDILDAVYASLLDASKTAPSQKRVVKGDPAHSFLIQKAAGTQNDQGYTDCKNQDATHSQHPLACGDPMPQGSASLCDGSRTRFDKLAAWIAQGANEN